MKSTVLAMAFLPGLASASFGITQDAETKEYVFCDQCPAISKKVIDWPPPKVASPSPALKAAVAVSAGSIPPARKSSIQVHFAFDSASLSIQAEQALKAFTGDLAKAIGPIHVLGHTDRVGRHGHNVTLAERRTVTVRDQLIRLGISRDRIKVEWNCCVGYPPDVNPDARRVLVEAGM